MKEGQENIIYLTGDSEQALRTSTQLEGFRAKGIEVLLMAEPIDAFWPERLAEYEGKKLQSVFQAAEDMLADEDQPAVPELLAALKTALQSRVDDVRTTSRLTDSAVILGAAKGTDLQFQRLMKRTGRMTSSQKPVLEINPRHPLIVSLAAKHDDVALIGDAAHTLMDLAMVQDGESLPDPAGFSRRVTTLLAGALGNSAA
jgi:molecular chaperone HtpG